MHSAAKTTDAPSSCMVTRATKADDNWLMYVAGLRRQNAINLQQQQQQPPH